MRAETGDNHWLDGLVGSAVAASMCGVHLGGTQEPVQQRRKVSLAAMQEYKKISERNAAAARR